MINTKHPWQVGPSELIDFALERMHKGSDFDRRLAFLILDVGVETLFKTYLTLPGGVTKYQTNWKERSSAVEGNFPELLLGVQKANPEKATLFNFAYLEHYHKLRNTLYHQGNQVTAVPMNQLEGYAKLAVKLLREYLDVNLSSKLKRPRSAKKGDEHLEYSREQWMKRGSYESMAVVDALIDIVREINAPKVSYTKSRIAVGTSGKMFIWCHPRNFKYLRFGLRVGEAVDGLLVKLKERNIQCEKGGHFPDRIKFAVTTKEVKDNKDIIFESIRIAEELSRQ